MKPSKLAAFVLALAVGSSAYAGDWYRWRGPEQDGVSREKNLPSKWNPEGNENVVWTNNIGSMSSPIVMNGKIYTIGRSGEVPAGTADAPTYKPGPMTQESYVCVDAKTGKTLWTHHENMTQTDVPFHRIGWSNAVGDPKTNRVYFFGCQCWLLCLDGDTGKVIWKRQMTEEFGVISTFGGRTPSPAIGDDQLFLAGIAFGFGDNARGQHRIFAFNKDTGELNWTNATGGPPTDAPQNTPVITVVNGERLVIFGAGDGGVHAFQARTGKKVWSHYFSKRGLNASVIVDGTRVYASADLENLDSPAMGAVICLDISSGQPKEVWKHESIEAGFPSGTVQGDTLYVLDNKAMVWALDKETGKTKWKQNCGRIGKAALVYGDGKLYVAEANGRFTILDVSGAKPKVLSKTEVPDKLGREYAIYGTPAISDGHVILQCANQTYCIGEKDAKVASDPVPELPDDTKEAAGPAEQLQVVPADIFTHPGSKTKLTARAFDAKGHPVKLEGDVKWSVGQLTMPPPPRPPASQPNAKMPPTPGPSKVGNLTGEVSGDGEFSAAGNVPQGGAVIASAGKLTGESRVRVLPMPPFKYDFEKTPVGSPPLTWTGAGGKFAVSDMGGDHGHVLEKLIDPPGHVSIPPKALYARARTNFGSDDMHDYTVQADVRVTGDELTDGDKRVIRMPDAGIIDSRYVLEIQGSTQTVNIHVWQDAMPDYTSKSMDFAWKPDTWYRLKLQVSHEGSKAILKGKAWPADGQEPDKWMIELDDPNPNMSGNPGLWGFSNERVIYYDNILVTPNAGASADAAGAKPPVDVRP